MRESKAPQIFALSVNVNCGSPVLTKTLREALIQTASDLKYANLEKYEIIKIGLLCILLLKIPLWNLDSTCFLLVTRFMPVHHNDYPNENNCE